MLRSFDIYSLRRRHLDIRLLYRSPDAVEFVQAKGVQDGPLARFPMAGCDEAVKGSLSFDDLITSAKPTDLQRMCGDNFDSFLHSSREDGSMNRLRDSPTGQLSGPSPRLHSLHANANAFLNRDFLPPIVRLAHAGDLKDQSNYRAPCFQWAS